MGVVTAQILILVLGIALMLLGWVLIRRADGAVSNADNALLSQAVFAILPRSVFNLAPAIRVRATAPSRAPPALSLRQIRIRPGAQ